METDETVGERTDEIPTVAVFRVPGDAFFSKTVTGKYSENRFISMKATILMHVIQKQLNSRSKRVVQSRNLRQWFRWCCFVYSEIRCSLNTLLPSIVSLSDLGYAGLGLARLGIDPTIYAARRTGMRYAEPELVFGFFRQIRRTRLAGLRMNLARYALLGNYVALRSPITILRNKSETFVIGFSDSKFIFVILITYISRLVSRSFHCPHVEIVPYASEIRMMWNSIHPEQRNVQKLWWKTKEWRKGKQTRTSPWTQSGLFWSRHFGILICRLRIVFPIPTFYAYLHAEIREINSYHNYLELQPWWRNRTRHKTRQTTLLSLSREVIFYFVISLHVFRIWSLDFFTELDLTSDLTMKSACVKDKIPFQVILCSGEDWQRRRNQKIRLSASGSQLS